MAGGSMKDIKLRIKSVENTMQITKAMELVASSKLKKARDRMESARPYFMTLFNTLNDIAAYTVDFSSPFLVKRPVKKSAYVLIAGDRGLAGGYNNNMFKLFTAHSQDKNAVVIPVGKKAVDFCKRRNIEIFTEEYSQVEDLSSADCTDIGDLLSDSFEKGEIDEVFICYTTFVSMLSQSPEIIQVLPLVSVNADTYQRNTITEYEPDPEELFHMLVPQFVTGLVYGAVTESWASELAARRTAMDAASKNAQEMVSGLSLQYNRARQAAITQEITEIVAGAGEG
ncbi:MAG: ATP synthase F1 subunit gamma [Oscillospiraceae bacterium]|nr:ATP synthase F1 subunit gamma [Oscillospiraceae bacterium]